MPEGKKADPGGHSHVSPVVKGFAGSIGGVAEACCLQPMDVIKTRLQLDKAGKYHGIVHCGRTIASEEGVKALWKGLTPFATHLTLKYALRMGSNSIYSGALRDSEGKLTDGRRMLAGFMAGITEALIIVTPFEVVKIRLQQQRGLSKEGLKYKGPIHCAATVLREEGLRGMWSGATPTILRNGTNQMCLFWAKNNTDKFLWDKHEGDGKMLTPGQSMTSGFLAALLGPIATGPFDVAKTRLMAQTKTSGGVRYTGFFDALRRIPAEEGVRAMWKGLLPRLLRIPPGQAIVWAVSDQITGYFEQQALLKASGGLAA
ncbi:Succinate/fumarate mitochondrial transporter [Tetrabaena socialis]|uniref:Succinate/fumarate mitochondrial transporter n=1 Tax=Tetrabaena socialis TaxID=47790 RepID=A0A2J8A232_9CHLO|nr:Succinate/fumarate mitochondrial transporter [Tetrabaena socialis]|eukprot:PNH06570.1 Succinate/fumarate mitochondrial transporter [Tetrabaena socialis]